MPAKSTPGAQVPGSSLSRAAGLQVTGLKHRQRVIRGLALGGM